MAAGDKVTLNFTGDGLLSYSVEQGAIDALAENSGLIKSDGGLVVMTARAADALLGSVVNNSGIIEAQTLENKGGRILLLSDMKHGETIVSGTLDASAPNGGDGGFIETSAAKVSFGKEMKVNASSKHGVSGTWLIDPYNYTIDAAAAAAIVGNSSSGLNSGTSVTVDTSSSNTSYGSSTNIGDAGDITVTAPIAKTSGVDATLTLKAARHIDLQSGANISSTTGKLNVQLWADSDNSGDGIIKISNSSSDPIISTNGGWLKFGNNETSNGYLVGGDVFFSGAASQTISTGGGAIDIFGETILGGHAQLEWGSR